MKELDLITTKPTEYVSPSNFNENNERIKEAHLDVIQAINKHIGTVATDKQRGHIMIATSDEVKAGKDQRKALTPKGLKDYIDDKLQGDIASTQVITNSNKTPTATVYDEGLTMHIIADSQKSAWVSYFGADDADSVLVHHYNHDKNLAVQYVYFSSLNKLQLYTRTLNTHWSKPRNFANEISERLAEHEKLEGTYQVAGHVKLSNAVNSQSSVSDGVAATPKAVKDAYDKANNHANDKNNPHNVTKTQVGLSNVDNVKQATKSEFDRHAGLIGSFGATGHVKLSNHTTSENSVGDGVAATPLAVKTVNDRIDNLDSELHNDITWIKNNAHSPADTPNKYPEGVTMFKTTVQDEWNELVGVDTDARYFITTYRNQNINVVYQKIVRMRRISISTTHFDGMWIRTAFRVDLPWSEAIRVDSKEVTGGTGGGLTDPKDSDVPFTDYPLGVSVFYTNAGDSGYPNRIVTVMTVRDDDRTAFQFAARNGYADVSKHMWYRIGHYQTGWSEWYQIADNRDINELKKEISDLRNAIIQLGGQL